MDDDALAARDSGSPLDVLHELERAARERSLLDTTPVQLRTLREQVDLIFWARENDDRLEHVHQMDLLAEDTGRRLERQAAIGGWIVLARQMIALVAFVAVVVGGIALAYDNEQLGTFLRTFAW